MIFQFCDLNENCKFCRDVPEVNGRSVKFVVESQTNLETYDIVGSWPELPVFLNPV